MNLDYTGNYIHATNGSGQNDYLSIQNYDSNYDWFAGFLTNKTDASNKYFLLTNLRVDNSKTAKLVITNDSACQLQGNKHRNFTTGYSVKYIYYILFFFADPQEKVFLPRLFL